MKILTKKDKSFIYHQRIVGILHASVYFGPIQHGRTLILTATMSICIKIIEKISLEAYKICKLLRMHGRNVYPKNYIFFCFREEVTEDV